MSQLEQELAEVAAGTSWRFNKLTQMIAATESLSERIEKVASEIESGGWEGDAADTARRHLVATAKTFQNAKEWLDQVSKLIADANDHVVQLANTRLEELPPGNLPTGVLDAFTQGKFGLLAAYGVHTVSKGPAGLAQLDEHFAAQREKAAADAWREVQGMIGAEAEALKAKIEVGFDMVDPDKGPTGPGAGGEEGSEGQTDGSGGPGSNGPGVSTPGVGGPPTFGPNDGGGSGPSVWGPNDGNTDTPDGPDVNGPDTPDGPNDPTDPPVFPPPYPPDPPFEPPLPPANPDVYPPNGPGGGGPSVDSNLDGSTLRSGLGAAGLGAAGLAAGAKLAGAGGSGSALGLGGVGQGAFGAGAGGAGLSGGAGLRGAASAAPTSGAGGAGAGSSNSSGGARAGRGGMMMGGGGGGGGTEKKSARSGLGYIAPKLEDEGDGGPAARASRAGGRVPEE